MVLKKKKVSDKKPIKKTSGTGKTKKVVKKTTDEKVVKKKKVSKTKVKEKEITKSSGKKKSPQKKGAEVRKTNKERKTFLNLMKIEKAKLNGIAKIKQIDENTLFILKNIFNEK